jgi:hypothetical protein
MQARSGNRRAGDAAGYLDLDYILIVIDGKKYKAHRIAHLLMTGHWPEGNPEHKNQQGCGNRWSNIKDLATKHDDKGIEKLRTDNISGLRGVSCDNHKKKWHAKITVYGKTIHLGNFDNPEEAGLTWDAAARLVWIPRFQHLNHPGIMANHIVLL